MQTITDIVRSFYAELESISKVHKELTDTDVREDLHLVLNYCFIWGNPPPELPINYSMFSQSGDEAVALAVERFLQTALPIVERDGLPCGQERLNVLQDFSITTPDGEIYDLFIGHSDGPLPPEPLREIHFSPGNYGDEDIYTS